MIINEERLLYRKKSYIKVEARRALTDILGMRQGENFKRKIALKELIEYKVKNSNEQFIAYVGAIEQLITYCKILFNIDLSNENIDMNWTGEEIINIIIEKYMNKEKNC